MISEKMSLGLSVLFAPAEGRNLGVFVALSPENFLNDGSLFKGIIFMPSLATNTIYETSLPFIEERVSEDNIYHRAVGAGTEFFGNVLYVFVLSHSRIQLLLSS